MHKKNQVFLLIYKLRVTVKLHREVCSLSDADSHFFPKQKNSFSCSLLNVCTIVQRYTGIIIKILKEN